MRRAGGAAGAGGRLFSRPSAGSFSVEAALGIPMLAVIVALNVEHLIIQQRIDRVRRALESVATEARGDKRLQSDIWTASSPTSW